MQEDNRRHQKKIAGGRFKIANSKWLFKNEGEKIYKIRVSRKTTTTPEKFRT